MQLERNITSVNTTSNFMTAIHLDQWLNHSTEILTRKPKKQSSVAQRTDTPPTREVKRIPIRIGRWHACGPPRPWLSPRVRTPRRRCRWPKGFRIGIKHFLKSQQTVSTKTCVMDKNRDHMIVFACLMKMSASNVRFQNGTSFAHLDFTISVKLFWNDFTFSERIILSGSLLYTSTMANNERLNMIVH